MILYLDTSAFLKLYATASNRRGQIFSFKVSKVAARGGWVRRARSVGQALRLWGSDVHP